MLRIAYFFLMIALLFFSPAAVSADDPSSGPLTESEKAARSKQLKGQLKRILDELDELEKPSTTPAQLPTEPAPAVEQPAEAPREVNLQDVSIISRRVQKRPEGVSQSATVPTEYDSQPTRTMRESLESLPGIVLRQANGPRDFSIAIRGSGVKTTFAVRDIKIYEDGISQTQSDGLSRLDIHDPWFMRSIEVL